MDDESGESTEEDGVTEEGRRETAVKRNRELVPETR